MSNIKKDNLAKKIELAKILKGIIVTSMIISVLISATACKEAPAVVEEQPAGEEQHQGEIKNDEVVIPSEIKEEAPEPVEWEGVKITPIEGLRFDKGTFYAEAGNPYGLEEGEKAGVFVKDAVEINEVMESSIGLRPEVIEVMQKEIMEEEKRFVYPFPIDLEQAKADLGQDSCSGPGRS